MISEEDDVEPMPEWLRPRHRASSPQASTNGSLVFFAPQTRYVGTGIHHDRLKTTYPFDIDIDLTTLHKHRTR